MKQEIGCEVVFVTPAGEDARPRGVCRIVLWAAVHLLLPIDPTLGTALLPPPLSPARAASAADEQLRAKRRITEQTART
jgi:hypothetical protein